MKFDGLRTSNFIWPISAMFVTHSLQWIKMSSRLKKILFDSFALFYDFSNISLSIPISSQITQYNPIDTVKNSILTIPALASTRLIFVTLTPVILYKIPRCFALLIYLTLDTWCQNYRMLRFCGLMPIYFWVVSLLTIKPDYVPIRKISGNSILTLVRYYNLEVC